MRLYLDTEAQCFLNLKDVGSGRWLRDRSCRFNSIQWAVDDKPVVLVPYEECVRGSDLRGLVDVWYHADQLVAHNAIFEIEAFAILLGLERPLRYWIDTMTKCAYYGYPLDLDRACKALQCLHQKDAGGKAVMIKLASGLYCPETAPEDFERLYSYGVDDVLSMRDADRKLPDLPADMQERWLVDTEINLRGVPVDMQMVNNALRIRDYVTVETQREMQALTESAVEKVTQGARILSWLAKGEVQLPDIKADTVARTLHGDALTDGQRRVLELRQEASLSSLAKYKKIQNYEVNGKLFNMFKIGGAHTWRPTGRGPQLLNLPRDKDPVYWANLISNEPWFLHHVSRPGEKLKGGMRGVICADPGYTFLGYDLAQIEARITAWLSRCAKLLNLFRTSDPYCTYGQNVFGRVLNKKDDPEPRNAIKAQLLSQGFAGGIGAYQTSGENYEIDFDLLCSLVLPTATYDERMEGHKAYQWYIDKDPEKPLTYWQAVACDILKQRYRKDFPEVVQFWKDLEDAFIHGGWVNSIYVSVERSGLRIVTLPSGRQMFYHGVVVRSRGRSREYSYIGRNGRKGLWKGTLMENVVQATNADICDWYKIRANRLAPVVHHCYDEATVHVRKEEADWKMLQLRMMALTQPEFTEGLPIGFDFWKGDRYGK